MTLEHPAFLLRRAGAADLPALRAVYASSVQHLARGLYSAEQLRVWAGFADTEAFGAFVLDVDTRVAQIGDRIAGFCAMGADGHVAALYVAATDARRGVGTRLLTQALEAHPSPTSGRYYAETSRLSFPLFLKLGFHHTATERTLRETVAFDRYLVERIVGGAARNAGASGSPA